MCSQSDIVARVVAHLPVDLVGIPFTLSNNILATDHDAEIELYHCKNCGEQWGAMGWTEVAEHVGIQPRETKECNNCGNDSVVHFQNGNGHCENCGQEETE